MSLFKFTEHHHIERINTFFIYEDLMVKEVSAAHILVDTEKKAKDIREMIYGGEKFSDLAKKYSSCPSKKNGGDLGWFSRGDMVKEFENAAFSADKGAVVGPVRTQFGWHLIYIKDVR